MRWGFYLSCFLLFSCVSVQEKEEKLQSANAHIELAISYLSQNDFSAAVEQLEKSRAIASDNTELDHAYAIYYQKIGDRDKAEVFFKAALEREPTNPRFNNNYGVLLSEMGKYDDAYKSFEIAYINKEYIQRSSAYENYGDAAQLNLDYERAIRAYEEALALDPNWFILQVKLAKSHYNNADFTQSYNYFSTYMDNLRRLNLSPSTEDLELGIGIAAALKDFEAVENYQELLINLD